MAAVPLFWNTNMAAVTSRDNALYGYAELLEGKQDALWSM